MIETNEGRYGGDDLAVFVIRELASVRACLMLPANVVDLLLSPRHETQNVFGQHHLAARSDDAIPVAVGCYGEMCFVGDFWGRPMLNRKKERGYLECGKEQEDKRSQKKARD